MFGHVVVCDPPVWKLEMALEINDEYALRHYTANYGLSAIVRDMWYWGPCCVALVETHEKPSRKIIEYAVDLTDTEVVATWDKPRKKQGKRKRRRHKKQKGQPKESRGIREARAALKRKEREINKRPRWESTSTLANL